MGNKGNLKWGQFALMGVGLTTGTGYFLGSMVAIQKAGLAVLITFSLAAIGTYIVYEALAQLFIMHPEQGSFRTYAKMAYGRWAGFSNGWIYWISEMLILGSTLTALGLFTQYWIPSVSLWVLASLYAALAVVIVALGVRGFERTENALSVVKIAAILLFVIVAATIFFKKFGYINHQTILQHTMSAGQPLFSSTGVMNLWTSLIFCFYAFGGIEVLGLMAPELKEPKKIIRAGQWMIISLTVLYLSSIFFAILLMPKTHLSTNESPFVIALTPYHLPVLLHFFNAIFVVAGFSVLIASLYSVTLMLVSLAEDGDAPRVFQRSTTENSHRLPLPALFITTLGLFSSLSLTYMIPTHVYEDITTAAGIMLLYTWMFILLSHRRIMNIDPMGQAKSIIGFLLIISAIVGALFDKTSRIGFFASLAFVVLLVAMSLIRHRKQTRLI
ncbi:putative transporter YcgH [Alicyclobacillus acidoterrestris]|uniref:amino acid permease n=1 Tax=Alicyclobacillus suci TaxID=2816080 RepID=UPI0011936C82|nr:amino acid permease [Alicyclobacillus suci]GEO27063.1 putative transporter YcgH [Alicyclobacillus acidoterrestris]